MAGDREIVLNITEAGGDDNIVLKKVHLDSNLSKSSKKILQKISKELETIFHVEKVTTKVEKDHHITYAYFNEITSAELGEIIGHLYSIKMNLQGIQMINKDITYDQSLHHITVWESNVTGENHIVLTPHNPESIYKSLIIGKNITPHINLAKIDSNDPKVLEELQGKVKIIVKKYIKDNSIYGDISKINIHI